MHFSCDREIERSTAVWLQRNERIRFKRRQKLEYSHWTDVYGPEHRRKLVLGFGRCRWWRRTPLHTEDEYGNSNACAKQHFQPKRIHNIVCVVWKPDPHGPLIMRCIHATIRFWFKTFARLTRRWSRRNWVRRQKKIQIVFPSNRARYKFRIALGELSRLILFLFFFGSRLDYFFFVRAFAVLPRRRDVIKLHCAFASASANVGNRHRHRQRWWLNAFERHTGLVHRHCKVLCWLIFRPYFHRSDLNNEWTQTLQRVTPFFLYFLRLLRFANLI